MIEVERKSDDLNRQVWRFHQNVKRWSFMKQRGYYSQLKADAKAMIVIIVKDATG